MRLIQFPSDDELKAFKVYKVCINSISKNNVDLYHRFIQCSLDIFRNSREYEAKAHNLQLYQLQAGEYQDTDLIIKNVNKSNLITLYDNNLVKNKNGRVIYDRIKSLAAHDICPFCGLTEVTHLDHYLAKTQYPQYSVLPINLVPACSICNTIKGSKVALTFDEQVLHPYFDNERFTNDQWLYAKVSNTDILSDEPQEFEYFVTPPNHWDNESQLRVKKHFDIYQLSSRYKVQASSAFSDKRYYIRQFLNRNDYQGLIQDLRASEQSCSYNYINSWNRAFHGALLDFYGRKLKESITLEACPRCRASGLLLGLSCNICDGAGALSSKRLNELSHIINDPVNCTKCMLGESSCIFCRGKGSIPIEEYWVRCLDSQ
jgi:hypothetical protein